MTYRVDSVNADLDEQKPEQKGKSTYLGVFRAYQDKMVQRAGLLGFVVFWISFVP